MAYHYSLYNLILESEQPLKELQPIPPPDHVDVRAELAHAADRFAPAGGSGEEKWRESVTRDAQGTPMLVVYKFERDGAIYFRLAYRSGNQFVVDAAGTHIWRAAPASAAPEASAAYLLGPLLTFVLRLRGVACLHASAVRVGEYAIAFAGEPHRGKSTTAAALARAGCPLLSDDMVTLFEEGERSIVYPGYPGVRLWLDSAEQLGESAENLPRLIPDKDKRYLDLAGARASATNPLPLAAIYILSDRTDDPRAPYCEPLTGHAGIMALVRHSAFGSLADPEMRAREFEIMGRVAARVALRRLVPHANLARLADLVNVVLADAQMVGAGSSRPGMMVGER